MTQSLIARAAQQKQLKAHTPEAFTAIAKASALSTALSSVATMENGSLSRTEVADMFRHARYILDDLTTIFDQVTA